MPKKPSHVRVERGAGFRGPKVIAAYSHLDLIIRVRPIDGQVYAEVTRKRQNAKRKTGNVKRKALGAEAG